MRDIFKLAAALLIISVLSGIALAFSYRSTKEKIESMQLDAEQKSLASVFAPGATIAEQTSNDPLLQKYWVARTGEVITGYAFKVGQRGYSSTIETIVGFDTLGAITGVTILSQSETPGLGDRMLEVASNLYIWNGIGAPKSDQPPWFCAQFVGLDASKEIGLKKGGEWHSLTDGERKKLSEANQISAIGGATISSRAVVRGLEEKAYPAFEKARDLERTRKGATTPVAPRSTATTTNDNLGNSALAPISGDL